MQSIRSGFAESLFSGVCTEDWQDEISCCDGLGPRLAVVHEAGAPGYDSLGRYSVWRGSVRCGLSEVFRPRPVVRDEPVVSVGAVHDRKFAI